VEKDQNKNVLDSGRLVRDIETREGTGKLHECDAQDRQKDG
jgi:hypothetical protein